MLPAARLGDLHLCPAHGPSPVQPPCATKVLIENKPAARKGDVALCPSGPDAILDGSPTVQIGNAPAARMTESCAHGGAVITGAATVFIGNPAVGPDGMAIQIPPLCAFLKTFGDPGKGATGGTLSRLRDAYTLSGPTKVSAQPLGDAHPITFNARTVEIRGHVIVIYEPVQGVSPPQWLPSADSVAQGLATLSDEQLRNIRQVYIVPHPLDAAGSPADYHQGIIRYFPRGEPHPQSDIDWALQHESGHAYWFAELLEKDPSLEDAWQRAANADHRDVTAYGGTLLREDFAEFMVLFASVKGTPCEASAKALFPHRWAIMEKLFPNGMPTRNPRYTSKKF
ncbi:MAG: PAAR domain-containing protein [Polyangiaceae bacterium]